MKNGSIAKLCGYYAPAVAASLDFLQSEQKKREEKWQRTNPYRRDSVKKIADKNIDEIMSFAFGPSLRYMGDIRRCYSNSEKSGTIRPIKPSSWNFNAKILKDECAKCQIDISEKINEIQRLYISKLTVAEVLSKGESFITADIKNEIKQDIHTFISVLETNYSTQYWEVVFKYFSKCISYPFVKDLVLLLPQCKISFIHNWIRQIENFSSPFCRKDRCTLEEDCAFLEDFSEELLALAQSHAGTSCTWGEVLYSLTVEELFHAKSYEYLAIEISKHKLRADDLHLAYLVKTQLPNDYKEIFYDALADELNLDCAIAYC